MKNNFWIYFNVILKIVIPIFIAFVLLIFIISQGWLGELPSIDEIKDPQKQISSIIYSEDNIELGKLYIQNRTELNYNQIPDYVVNALIATEDIRFYSHCGIDIKGLFTAFVRTFFMFKKSGASTITQQLAKNLFHNTVKKNFIIRSVQKLKEWYIAIIIERNFSKNEILALYLNTVPYLHNSFGIKEAAETYFSKKVEQLTIDEAAILIGMLKGPAQYNPKNKPENCFKRRNVVLSQMLKHDFISSSQYEELIKLPINTKFKLTSENEGLATYLREQIRLELDDLLEDHRKQDGTSYNIYKDGLKIYTTIDSKLQELAESALKDHMTILQKNFDREWGRRDPYKFGSRKNPNLVLNIVKESKDYMVLSDSGYTEKEILKKLQTEKRQMTVFTWNGNVDTSLSFIDSIKYVKRTLHAGVVSLDPKDGRIKAYVGGINFNYFKINHLNKNIKRQVGSIIKPFLYSIALESGETPCTEYIYSKPQIEGHLDWDPKGTKYFKEGEKVSLKNALQVSDNRIAALLIKKFTPQALIDLIEKYNFDVDFEKLPSIALGVTDISLIDIVGAYTTFMNNGIYSTPYYIDKIIDKNGSVIYDSKQNSKEILSVRTAYLINKMMQNVTISRGTASRLRTQFGLKNDIAAKTGTTQSNSDGWFLGSTPDLLTGVWVGADEPSVSFASTALGQGASSALPIWGKIYSKLNNMKNSIYIRNKKFNFNVDSLVINEYDCIFPIEESINSDSKFENDSIEN